MIARLRRAASRRSAAVGRIAALALFAGLAVSAALPANAQPATQAVPATTTPAAPLAPTYADLVSLAESADVVLVARIADQAVVPAERAPGLEPGKARLYLEAETEAVLGGRTGVGGEVAFLADRALRNGRRPPRLKRQRYLLFADTVAGRADEIALAAPGGMLPAEPALVERTRAVLRQIAAAGPLPRVTGVREVISVAGNLAGESETQLFLQTQGGEPVSLTTIRRPGMAPRWGVSWTEIVDPSATPPLPDTLEWYRLACFLPDTLPEAAFLQDQSAMRAQAREDYALMLQALGPCARSMVRTPS